MSSFATLRDRYITGITKPGTFGVIQPIFESCIAQFCDPAAYSPSLRVWPDLLENRDVFAAFGLHPHSAKYYNEVLEGRILEAANSPKCVAIGECGLDYHYNHSTKESQLSAFRRQLELAVVLHKPVVIHSRDAEDDTLTVLREFFTDSRACHLIHMHCYCGSRDFTLALLESFPGMKFGFTGNITFVEQVARCAEMIPMDRILLETDGPHMCPNVNSPLLQPEIGIAGASDDGATSNEGLRPDSSGGQPGERGSGRGRGRGRGRDNDRVGDISRGSSDRGSDRGRGRGRGRGGGGRGGGVCHSGHIPSIAAALSSIKRIPLKDVFVACRENTRQLYGV